ncbi:MAG: M24 family metallopeptidase [Actinobacteria bacterium]|nr:M24 family metallopeptidase [Actinomycetota bacterium]MCL5986829.1 M24 family metallopeptidase [Actinomycetota bacterium]
MINMKITLPKIDTTIKIPKGEFETRIKKVQNELYRRKIDFGIAYGTPIIPGDVLYLSGYDVHLESSSAIIISPTKMFVLGGPESVGCAQESMRAGEWRNLKEFQLSWEDYPQARFSPLREVIDEAVEKKNVKRVGMLTSADIMSVDWLELVKRNTDKNAEFLNATDILAEARYIKSKNELELIRLSNKIAIEAIKIMIEVIEPGMRELEVAAYGDYVAKSMGAYNYGYDTLVTTGERTNTIIGRTGNKIIEKGDICIFGVSARYEGYSSAPGRTIVVGGANKGQVEFLEHALTAHALAVEKFVYGKPARDLDIVAREYYKKVGLAQYQIYSTGHGTGISEAFEGKAATRYSDYNFPKNIVMMIDVGLYGHPDYHGQRHEEAFIINDKGETEKISDLPMRLYKKK